MIKAFNLRKILTFIVSVLLPLAIGWLSAYVTGDIQGVYDSLIQPPFAPPGWVFPVVWTVLYILMGIALYIIVKNGFSSSEVREAVLYFGITLIFNFLWTPVFFRFGLILFALIWLAAMIILAVINIIQFYKINKWAGILLIPYLIWLLFAFALNLGVYLLNGPTI
ncbi:MAG: tryptophan-rich sensory protein [Ruminococcaceae bacterium]|nr:tryptophan-rich sensory protein [Oscillospiraceae bacterium]